MLLANYLNQINADPAESSIILSIAQASCTILHKFDANSAVKVSSTNETGDNQIKLDVLADEIFTGALSENPNIHLLSSEEQPDTIKLTNKGTYAVAFDPLDGSSLVDTNFSVGSIIGIYKTETLIGSTGKDLTAAVYIMYGPRTILVAAINNQVFSATLQNNDYYVTKTNLQVAPETNYFAPGNLKAAQANPGYNKLIQYWLTNQYKLRYSGGMVPDLHHILYKGSGVFCYPGSSKQPSGKLRLVYECLPMAKIIETAGGASSDGYQSILSKKIAEIHERTPICIGSKTEVDRYNSLVTHAS